jgi:hypothetical protein
MLAAGEGDARVVCRVFFEVEPLRFFVHRVEVFGRFVLPAGVGHKRTVWTQSVEQSLHYGLRTADHVAERGHPAMDHSHPARLHPEVFQILNQP